MEKAGIAIKEGGLKSLKPVIKIDVVSDVVCPWCYIGKRRLEKAMTMASDKFTFEVTYHPFELNPTTPPSGFNQREYLAEKFGGQERYDSITGHTSGVAAQEGLVMNYDKQVILPNTRKAHAIIFASQSEKAQIEVTEAFFKAYFTDGVDLSKDENLISVAEAAGLDRNIAETAINSQAVIDSISEQEHEIQKLGVRGVPFYIFNSEHGVSGAQAPETFLNVFNELKSSATGDTCEIGGEC